jgi:hypothetical protein
LSNPALGRCCASRKRFFITKSADGRTACRRFTSARIVIAGRCIAVRNVVIWVDGFTAAPPTSVTKKVKKEDSITGIGKENTVSDYRSA